MLSNDDEKVRLAAARAFAEIGARHDAAHREFEREAREVALQKYESRMQRCNEPVTFVFGVDEIDDPYKDVGIIGTQFAPSCAHTK